MTERIAVIGLGYVGLRIAPAFARRVPHTVGFDINPTRVADIGPVLRTSATVGAALRHDSGYASIAYGVGYSPQRINPGNRERSLGKIGNVKAAAATTQSRPDTQYWSL